MDVLAGTSDRYLEVDLTNRSYSIYTVSPQDRHQYIGGKGLGLKFYYDRVHDLKNTDPLGEENILCFMMGVMIATGAPCSGRFECVTKSPLTGIMSSASCGGPFGIALKTAGYDGIIVKGKSASPVYLVIDRDGLTFEDAVPHWGKTTHGVQHDLDLGPKDGAAVIGPAGENKVLYANIASGHRFLGRGGMGAVMGSKNLKAIVARGGAFEIAPKNPKFYEKTRKKALKYVLRNGFSKGYRKYGTNYGVRPGIKAGFIPIYNFRDRTDPRVEALSGEAMAERYKTTNSTCRPCTVLCGHKGTYPDGKVYQIPEYETIALFGPNIGNFNPDPIGKWNEEMNDMGMDTISCGTTLSWAMEANKRGLRPSELEFDKFDNVSKIIEDIAYQRGEGAELSLGCRRLSEKYGGTEFAIHVKGLEMAGYDPRAAWGHGLNYAVNNRGGCHLGSYLVAEEIFFGFLSPYSQMSKHVWVKFFEDVFDVINSVHTCLFTGFGYILEAPIAKMAPTPILKLAMTFMPHIAQVVMDWSLLSEFYTSITGDKMGMWEILKCGDRIHVLERYMNTQMGISEKDDTLPARFLTEAETKHPVKSVVPIKPMVRRYYKERGYDANGIPTPKLLKKLSIASR